MSYALRYYGADTIDTIDPFGESVVSDVLQERRDGLIPTRPGVARDRPRGRIVMPLLNSEVASTDQIGAIVKTIGDDLKLIYKVDDLSSIPERLGELVRRVAEYAPERSEARADGIR